MANFEEAIKLTISHEGGYQDIPEDAGNWLNGINYGTKWGITPHTLQAYFPALLSNPNCVRDLDMPTAISCYKQGYWKDLYSQINDQKLANKLFDSGVLFGVKTAVRLLQISMQDSIRLVSDGVFGDGTLSAINLETNLISKYRPVLIQHVVNIVNNNPSQTVFINGWVSRINS